MTKQLNILISPLDWGLGHATRLVLLLRYLQNQKHYLIIGVSDLNERFLRSQIPNAKFVQVPSYDIIYNGSNSVYSLMRVLPKIINGKKEEHKWLKKFVVENQVDLIISDSRFGFYHSHIKSIIISHQLNLQYPKSLNLFGSYAQKKNTKWLKEFDAVWVPDSASHLLSGDLSVNKELTPKFINPQSRFQLQSIKRKVKEDYVLCIISGPEPQRTIFEDLLISQANRVFKKLVIVGGKPQENTEMIELPNVTYFNHLDDTDMQSYIKHADIIISRSGYSSIMDYHALACKHLFLVPTPGQTEQIYLAKRLKKQGVCDFEFQTQFSLSKAVISQSSKWKGFATPERNDDDIVFEGLMKAVGL